MVTNYKRFFEHKHYSFQEIMLQVAELKEHYSNVNCTIKGNRRCVETLIKLQPTAVSEEYVIKIRARVGSKIVGVFPVSPKIGRLSNGKKVPHMYKDGSLCLFYPKYCEWNYTDSWAETLVPWTSLWLYFYELWLQTGEWLGGGIHCGNTKPRK